MDRAPSITVPRTIVQHANDPIAARRFLWRLFQAWLKRGAGGKRAAHELAARLARELGDGVRWTWKPHRCRRVTASRARVGIRYDP